MANQIVLRHINEPNDFRRLEAWLNEAGDLVIEGQDIGDEVERFFGAREYEWIWTVRAADLPHLLAALGAARNVLFALEQRFSGDRAGDLKPFLDDHDVPHEVWSRVGD